MPGHQLVDVVTGIKDLAVAFDADDLWDGAAANVFRVALNDVLTTINDWPPKVDTLINTLRTNIEAVKATSGIG